MDYCTDRSKWHFHAIVSGKFTDKMRDIIEEAPNMFLSWIYQKDLNNQPTKDRDDSIHSEECHSFF